jgi:hypothetical protein
MTTEERLERLESRVAGLEEANRDLLFLLGILGDTLGDSATRMVERTTAARALWEAS